MAPVNLNSEQYNHQNSTTDSYYYIFFYRFRPFPGKIKAGYGTAGTENYPQQYIQNSSKVVGLGFSRWRHTLQD